MRVLVACESSGAVRDAFRAAGHDAMSCDLLPSEAPGPHHQGDVLGLLDAGWDLLIGHPPCTYLCSSGLHWARRDRQQIGLPWRTDRDTRTEHALAFALALANAPIGMVAIENPVGVLSTRWRPPDQIIQPWQFGHPEQKATCLWLRGLPALQATNILAPPPQRTVGKPNSNGAEQAGTICGTLAAAV